METILAIIERIKTDSVYKHLKNGIGLAITECSVVRGPFWSFIYTFIQVVVSNICYFHPYLGKISNLTNILAPWPKPSSSGRTGSPGPGHSLRWEGLASKKPFGNPDLRSCVVVWLGCAMEIFEDLCHALPFPWGPKLTSILVDDQPPHECWNPSTAASGYGVVYQQDDGCWMKAAKLMAFRWPSRDEPVGFPYFEPFKRELFPEGTWVGFDWDDSGCYWQSIDGHWFEHFGIHNVLGHLRLHQRISS